MMRKIVTSPRVMIRRFFEPVLEVDSVSCHGVFV